MHQNPHLEEINNDLKELLETCKESNLTEENIDEIFKPLTDGVKSYKRKRQITFLALILLPILIIYGLTWFETTYWHISAIGRIALIEILPLWDWTYLSEETCLIPGLNSIKQQSKTKFDCVLCEAMSKIYVEGNINDTFLKEHYMDLHNPVIILNELENWPIFRDPDWTRIKKENFDRSYPCKLSTNVYSGSPTAGKILKHARKFEEFFLHFQNCELDGMKAFRAFASRPEFLPAEISPVQYSWLLISQNYNVTTYKPIELTEIFTVIGQVSGGNLFRLTPRENCQDYCPELNIELARGEMLVFTRLWDLEYKPRPVGENFAVILELH